MSEVVVWVGFWSSSIEVLIGKVVRNIRIVRKNFHATYQRVADAHVEVCPTLSGLGYITDGKISGAKP